MLYVGRNERIGKQQWLSIRIHFRISTGSDGFIEAWENGGKLGRVNGRNSAGIAQKRLTCLQELRVCYVWNIMQHTNRGVKPRICSSHLLRLARLMTKMDM